MTRMKSTTGRTSSRCLPGKARKGAKKKSRLPELEKVEGADVEKSHEGCPT